MSPARWRALAWFGDHERDVNAVLGRRLPSVRMRNLMIRERQLERIAIGSFGQAIFILTPLAEQLKTLSLGLDDDPTSTSLFQALRGQRVEVTGAPGGALTGRLMSIESRTEKAGTGDADKSGGHDLAALLREGACLQPAPRIGCLPHHVGKTHQRSLEVAPHGLLCRRRIASTERLDDRVDDRLILVPEVRADELRREVEVALATCVPEVDAFTPNC